MGTTIRPNLSEKNKYWINKHRHYELKHFCLQYPDWKKAYMECNNLHVSTFEMVYSTNTPSDSTSDMAIKKIYYADRIRLIENIAAETDKELQKYILQAVTKGLSYSYLKSQLDIPCGKDMYYDRYRKFFWLLNKRRR